VRLSVEECLTAIETHTRGLGEAAIGHLDARIEHCPEWSMADLVWHLTEVHRFWEYVARTLPAGEPEDRPPSVRPDDGELVAGMLVAMAALVDTLRDADQDAPCWTWGLEENVGFITRHQVQEAAVHHWDALNAIGSTHAWEVSPVAAVDAVEEFLTQSAANSRWPMPGTEPIGGTLRVCACSGDGDLGPTWHITDGAPGTVAFTAYDEEAPEVDGPQVGTHAAPAAVLLWLYRRRPRPDDPWTASPGVDGDAMVGRFQALTNTD
jgi:uncharacterized protein (TIGR03083 family)